MRRAAGAAAIILAGAHAGPAHGQSVVDARAFVLATRSATTFYGAGLGMTLRPGGRLRAGLSGVVGRLEGAVAVRGEGVATFVLAPAKRRGWTVYGGGGAALVWSDGNYAEYALVVLGAEARPAARAGWFLEVGAGRGVRLAGGVRFHLGGRRRP